MWKVPCTHLPWLSCELQKHIGLSCFPYDFSCRHRLTESWSFQCLHALCDGNQWCQVLPWKGGRQYQHQKNLPLHWLTFSSGPYKRRKAEAEWHEEEKVGHNSPVFGTVTAFVSGSLRYHLNREMGVFKGSTRSLLSQGTYSDRGGCSNSHVPAAYSHEAWQRMYDRPQPNCRAVLDWDIPMPASGAGGFSIRVQAHTLALCLIWIHQSTELNAAREKDFRSDELFSFLTTINKRPLPLLLVRKLWGTKMPEISPLKLVSWHHL